MSEDLNELASSILDAIAAKVPSIDVDGLGPDLARALRRQGAGRREATPRRAVVQDNASVAVGSGAQVPIRLVTEAAETPSGGVIDLRGSAWPPRRRQPSRPRYQRVPFRG